MRKALVLAGLGSALLLGLAPSLSAHGGRYGGPSDTVPPNLGGSPGDTSPPGTPGGPTTPAGPNTPGGNRGPTTPGGTGTGAGARPGMRGGMTVGGRSQQTGSFDQWEFWWEANDDAFLELKQRLLQQIGSITVGPSFTGRRAVDPSARRQRVGAQDLAGIEGALLAALGEKDADVVDSAVLALARCMPAERGAELKQRLLQQIGSITVGPSFTGRRAVDPSSRRQRVGAQDLAGIEGALLAALGEKDADVVDSAVLALARCMPAERGAELVPAIVRVLGHEAKSAREAAALALGILGAPEGAPILRELVLDTPEGRRLTGQGRRVEDLVRAFAAASLGMIGSPDDVETLRRVVVDESSNASADVKALAILALGLVKGGHERAVPLLQQLLTQRELETLARAQAPIALATIAEQPDGNAAARATLSSLVGRFLDDKTDHDLRRSLAIALGRIARIDDFEAVDALAATASGSRDAQTRHYSMIALGQLAMRDATADRNAEVHRKLNELFRATLTSPRPATLQPWGALALALQGRNEQLDRGLRDEAVRKLRESLTEERNPSYRAASAIALGLIGATEAREELREAFAGSRDQPFRGYVAVASGLLLDRSSADELRMLLQTKGLDSRFKLQLARALGLLGDPKAVPVLVAHLRGAETLAEVASTAQALGLIGDREAVEPLLALLGDTSQPGLRRGFAAVALGLLGEKSELPWNAVFSVGSNYRAKTPALAEIFDIL